MTKAKKDNRPIYGPYLRDSRPYYGPWRQYTREELDEQIMASLKRENDFSRRWHENKGR